jgi:hypothetical protein
MSDSITLVENGGEKIFSTTLIVNIFLHVTILFTILANFFMYYIADISSNAINNELKQSIDESFEPLHKNKSKINDKINTLKQQYDILLKQYNNDKILQSQSSIINSRLNDILLQINNLEFIGGSSPVPISTNSLPALILPNLNDVSSYIKNLSFDYYLDLFSKNNETREKVNKQVFSEIKVVNFLLILFLVIFVATLNFTGAITMGEFGHILLENVITFFFVGIVEIVFFLNIALKFVPAPPSLIITSLLSSLKKIIN